MDFLKEDGSLDIERIRKLPHDEKCHVIGRFTREQIEEYFSKCPVNYLNYGGFGWAGVALGIRYRF